jgi:hypothetical protein
MITIARSVELDLKPLPFLLDMRRPPFSNHVRIDRLERVAAEPWHECGHER